MGAARFQVSFDFLRQILNLPVSSDIRFAYMPDRGDVVELTVVSPDLPHSPDVPPLITPTFRTEYQSIAVFDGWGQ